MRAAAAQARQGSSEGWLVSGQIGVPAERLAKTAAKRMADYLAASAFAGPYLQDQLLLPFGMAGDGAFTTVKLSENTRTAARLITQFTGREFQFRETGDGAWLVALHGISGGSG